MPNDAIVNTILGTIGDDSLVGSVGEDSIWGSEGNDIIDGVLGNDTISGGNGDDWIVYHSSALPNNVTGGSGFDILDASLEITPINLNLMDVYTDFEGIIGGSGNDVLQGNAQSNILVGGAGNDVLRGADGDDFLSGGSGNDTLEGGSGNDVLFIGGDSTTDSLSGGDGYDFLDASRSTGNLVMNGIGNSIESGAFGSGNDSIIGGTEGNLIIGGTGSDTLLGGDGSDSLYGGRGSDSISGGAGDDVIGYDAADSVSGGTGRDVLDASLVSRGVAINLAQYSDIENVIGGRYADTLTGNALDNVLSGGGGSNVFEYDVTTAFGNDTLQAGSGDILHLTGGSITTSNIDIEMSGNDLILSLDNGNLVLSDWNNHGMSEHLNLVEINGLRYLLAVENNQVVFKDVLTIGTSNDDYLLGSNADDSLSGFEGNDQLYGLGGNDVLDGGIGDDTLSGGAGNDVYVINTDNNGDDIIVKDAGNKGDIVQFQTYSDSNEDGSGIPTITKSGNDLVLTFDQTDSTGASNKLTLQGWYEGADYKITTFNVDGHTRRYDNLIVGNETADTLTGTSGNELLTGNGGSDILRGDAGADQIWGGIGADTLDGGTGNDTLQGGKDEDVYVFAAGSGNDVIEYEGRNNQGDTIVFGNDITTENVGIQQVEGNLVLTLPGNETLTLENWAYAGLNRINEFYFADGSVHYIAANDAGNLVWSDGTIGVATSGNDNLYGNSAGNNISGIGGNDLLYGGGGTDLLNGGQGNDTILGGVGADTLTGGAYYDPTQYEMNQTGDGNDVLVGGAGNDVYLFQNGFGVDTIMGSRSNSGDLVKYDLGASVDKVTVSQQGNDLVLTGGFQSSSEYYSVGNNKLVLENYFGGQNETEYRINRFQFGSDSYNLIAGHGIDSWSAIADSSVNANDNIVGTALNDLILGASGEDTVYGGGGNDYIRGGSGNDVLFGNDGADILNGESGNDTLTGGAGSDTYVYGSSQYVPGTSENVDVVTASADNSNDVVVFGSQYQSTTVGDLNFIRSGNDLLIQNSVVDQSSGGLVLAGYFDSAAGKVKNYAFKNISWSHTPGSNSSSQNISYSQAQWDNVILGDTVQGPAGNDTIAAYNDLLTGSAAKQLFQAGIGNDTIIGGSGAEILLGGAGNDILFGNDGADYLAGGIGSDSLVGGAGSDTYYFVQSWGSMGNDTVYGDSSDVVVFGGSGCDSGPQFEVLDNDVRITFTAEDSILFKNWKTTNKVSKFFVDGELMTIDSILVGTEGNDAMNGGANTDILVGRGGSDTLQGNAGKDLLYGGNGDDSLLGGVGNDELSGDSGNDTLYGGADNDQLQGGDGNDILFGEAGNDSFEDYNGDNYFSGGDGADYFYTGSGNDTILGDAGNDMVSESGGNNQISGGSGSDTFWINGSGNNAVAGDDGNDYIGLYNTGNNLVDAGSGSDTIYSSSGNDSIMGGDGNDMLFDYSGGNEALDGGLGNDILVVNGYNTGTTSSSLLRGGAGDDSLSFSGYASGIVYTAGLDGGDGNDTISVLSSQGVAVSLRGGSGNDVYLLNWPNGVVIDNNDAGGYDVVRFGSSYMEGSVPNSTQYEFSRVGNDLVVSNYSVNAVTFSNWFVGNDYKVDAMIFNDVQLSTAEIERNAVGQLILGNDGNNYMLGGQKGDTLLGFGGSDKLDGGSGSDILDGGDGSDILVYDSGDAAVNVKGGSGIDILDASLSTQMVNIDLNQYTANDIENVYGSQNFASNIFGNKLNNALYGGQQGDYLYGGEGNDSLFGGDAKSGGISTGNDQLFGGIGDDYLIGGDGQDTLDGGEGNDVLSGGSGADVYQFMSGNDTILGEAGMGSDIVQFQNAYTANDVVIGRSGNNLVLTTADGNSLTLNGWYDAQSDYQLNRFRIGSGMYEINNGSWQALQIQQDESSYDIYSNNMNDAFTISTIGSTVQGRINYSGDTDWFKFTAATGGTYTLSSTRGVNDSSYVDDMVYLYDSNGNSMGYDDDSNGSLQFRLTRELQAGSTYYAKVVGYSSYSVGGYGFTINQDSVDDYSNLQQYATDLSGNNDLPLTTQGTINQAGDHDWFKFTVPYNGAYSISVDDGNDSFGTFEARLLDQNSNQIGYSSSGGSNQNISISADNLIAGQTYYLDLSGNYTTNYNISFANNTVDPEGNDMLSASTVVLGESRVGTINFTNDTDYYRFHVDASGNETISVTNFSDSLVAAVFDQYGNTITSASSINGLLTFNAALAEAGDYYLSLQGNQTTSYSFSINQQVVQNDDYPNTINDAVWMTVGETKQGHIEQSYDQDWFKFTVPVSGTYNLISNAGNDGYSMDDYIELYDSNGILISSDDDSGELNNFSLTQTLSAGETYYAKVRGFSSNSVGSYSFTILQDTLPPVVEDPEGNDTLSASTVVLGDSLAGTINFAGDTDYYRFHVDASGNETINLVNPIGGLDATILDQDGNFIASTSDSINGVLNLNISLPGGNDYYLAIHGNEVTPYSFSISQQIVPNDTLDAGQEFWGYSGCDEVFSGGNGNDTYYFAAGSGHDTIGASAVNGNDIVEFGDTITRGNVFFGQSGNDLIVKYTSNDSVTFQGYYDSDTAGVKTIHFANPSYGSNGAWHTWNNVIVGSGIINGNDIGQVISGGNGNDTILGGAAKEWLAGGNGNDYIDAGDGGGRIYGQGGNDYLLGGNGNDIFAGANGNDTLYGNLGSDYLEGNSGNDMLIGGEGLDTYYFNVGFGNDMIAADSLNGGDILQLGNAQFTAQIVENDLLISYGSNDNLKLADWAITADSERITSFYFNGQLYGEEILGLSGAPISGDGVVIGTPLSEQISGGSGNDSLAGIGGIDTLIGGSGADTYVFDIGLNRQNLVIASDATSNLDTLQLRIDTQDIPNVIGRNGIEPSVMQIGNDLELALDNDHSVLLQDWFAGAEYRIGNLAITVPMAEVDFSYHLIIGNDDVADTLNGSEAGDMILGAGGNDVLLGNGGNDILRSEEGSAYLDGGSGNDILYAGGMDTVIGGSGNDLLIIDQGPAILSGGAGNDTYLVDVGGNDFYAPLYNYLDATVIVGPDNGNDVVSINLGTDYAYYIWNDAGYVEQYVAAHERISGQLNGNDLILSVVGIDGLPDNAFMTIQDYVHNPIATFDFIGDGEYRFIDGAWNEVLPVEPQQDTITGGAGADTYNYIIDQGGLLTIGESTGNSLDTLRLIIDPETMQTSADNWMPSAELIGNDLVLSLNDSNQLTLQGWNLGQQNQISNLSFHVQETGGISLDLNYRLALAGQSGGTLTGSALSEFMVGMDGNDIMTALGGDDLLAGGGGNDILSGGDGDDILIGDQGNDSVFGGNGFDMLEGGRGIDTLNGGADSDAFLVGSHGLTWDPITNTGMDDNYDVIIADSSDKIYFDSGSITTSNTTLEVSGNDLTLTAHFSDTYTYWDGTGYSTGTNNWSETLAVLKDFTLSAANQPTFQFEDGTVHSIVSTPSGYGWR